jgi:hypothetical protein
LFAPTRFFKTPWFFKASSLAVATATSSTVCKTAAAAGATCEAALAQTALGQATEGQTGREERDVKRTWAMYTLQRRRKTLNKPGAVGITGANFKQSVRASLLLPLSMKDVTAVREQLEDEVKL